MSVIAGKVYETDVKNLDDDVNYLVLKRTGETIYLISADYWNMLDDFEKDKIRKYLKGAKI